MHHSVVGFEFTGDSLLQGDFLPFREGLTIFYGLNGAGKTRLSEGVRAALTGVKSEVRLSMIIRLHEPTEHDQENDLVLSNRRSPGTGLLLAIAEKFALAGDFEDEGASRPILSLSRASEIIDRFIRAQFDARSAPTDLRDEVAADRLFLMHPVGTASEPRWDVWPVADRTGPRVAAALLGLKLADDEYAASEDSDEGADAYGEALRGRTLRGASAEWMVTSTGWLRPYNFVPYSGETAAMEWFHGFTIQGAVDFGIDVLPVTSDPNADTIRYIGEISVLAAANARTWEVSGKSSPPDSVRSALSSGIDFDFARTRVEAGLKATSNGDGSESLNGFAKLTELVDRLANEVALELEVRATSSIEQMMIDAPTPVLQLTAAITRFSRPAAQWLFRRARGGQLIEFENLSRAERIWAGAAVNDALYWHRRDHTSRPGDELRPLVTILDEPESALHRSAEAHTARALVERARDPRKIIFAATHSPELLDANEARIIEVKRGGAGRGMSMVRELDLADRAALDELGLMPSDLLRWPRVFLLVEGAHDEALLDAFFGDRLRMARVQILPLRGATKLPATIDSRVLFDFTDAHLVALVDNQDPRQISAAWTQALDNRESCTLEVATGGLAEAIPGLEEEARFLREWLTAALRKGVENRVTPYSLKAKDIIEYVPIDSLLATNATWDGLRAEHATAVEAQNGSPRDFKKWIEVQHRVRITPDLLRDAARDVDRVPDELERLMKTLEGIAHSEYRMP
jgi:predicted ATPase